MMKVNVFFKAMLKCMALLLIYMNSVPFYGQDELKTAVIAVDYRDTEEGRMVIAEVTDEDGVPGEDIEVSFYVQRTFSLMPFGDFFNATDENGKVEVLFPKELPGDKDGYIKLFVKILESDVFKDTSVEMNVKWGVPAKIDELEEKRSLWAAAANAPISLIVIVTALIAAVWYVLLHIIVKLYRISRI